MSVATCYELSNGKIWAVGCSLLLARPSSVSPEVVIIPINQMDDMDDAEIGYAVRSLIHTAQLAGIYELVQYISWHDIQRADQQSLLDWAEQLHDFVDEDPTIATTRKAVLDEIERRAMKDRAKSIVKHKRQQIRSEYEMLFLKIGRRDGFLCAHCESSQNDLQIDHIFPISKGGSNELENLQLLCRSCNNSKGGG